MPKICLRRLFRIAAFVAFPFLAAILCIPASAQVNSAGAGSGYCWINAATGQPVPTYPDHSVDTGDPNHRTVPSGPTVPGSDFVRSPDGSWINAATGQPVPTYPDHSVDTGDPNHRTVPSGPTVPGSDFVRVPCTPPPPQGTIGVTPIIPLPGIGFGFGRGEDRR